MAEPPTPAEAAVMVPATTAPDPPPPRRTTTTATTTTTTTPRLSLSARLPPWASKLRQMAAPVLVAFLSFVFITVPQLNHLGGQYAFLCYTSVILFFFPRGRVSQQIESNTINFLGAVCGLAWSSAVLALAAWCGAHDGSDSPQTRGVLGLGLALLSLGCGFLRSWVPLLNVACRAAMFFPIFLLTAEQTVTKLTPHLFLEQFYVALFAYAFSTIVGVVLSEHSSSPHLGDALLKSLRTTCELLPVSLHTVLEVEESPSASNLTTPASPDTPGGAEKATNEPLPPHSAMRTRQQQLARQLRSQVTATRAAHASYMLDIVHARQHPGTLVPIIRMLGRLQRNPLLGPTGHVPGERIRSALERTFATPAVSRQTSRHTSRSGTPRVRSRSTLRGVSMPGDDTPTQSPMHEKRKSSPGADLSAVHLAQKLSKVATHQVGQRHASGGSNTYPSPARSKLTNACNTLSDAIVAALDASVEDIAAACDWRNGEARNVDDALVPGLKAHLHVALRDLQKRLSGIIDTTDMDSSLHGTAPLSPAQSRWSMRGSTRGVAFEDEMTSADWLDDEDRFRIAFYMIALLDLAKDTSHLMDVATGLRHNVQPKRWIFPRIIWPWSKVTPETPIPTAAGEEPPDQQDPDPADHHEDLDFVHALLQEKERPRTLAGRSIGTRLTAAWRAVWDRRGVVTTRVVVSQTLHSLKHSRHVHFALKQTVGISMLSLPAFLPLGNPGRSWYDSSHGAWMVVSFMYVIEVTTGATMRMGFYRTIGTFIGASVGYVCALIAHENPYALVVLATACSVPISYGVLFTSVAPMAIVTGITLPPILFIQYLGLAGGVSEFKLAWERFVDIEIGIAAAVLLGVWLWPIHARVQYFSAVSDTVNQITEYYLIMSRDLLKPSLVYHDNHKKYIAVEANVRHQIARSRNLVSIQSQEISLLPRPVKLYTEVIDLTERLIETFAEIRVLRFSLPRKATVLDVLPIRRELVSSLLMNLWACGQAFRSRSPLPQLLPSPRVPLAEVMEATDEHARHVRTMRAHENLRKQTARSSSSSDDEHEHGGHPHGTDTNGHHAELAVLYGMAENEALGEAINSIDELLAAARTLFGTQTFMDPAGN